MVGKTGIKIPVFLWFGNSLRFSQFLLEVINVRIREGVFFVEHGEVPGDVAAELENFHGFFERVFAAGNVVDDAEADVFDDVGGNDEALAGARMVKRGVQEEHGRVSGEIGGMRQAFHEVVVELWEGVIRSELLAGFVDLVGEHVSVADEMLGSDNKDVFIRDGLCNLFSRIFCERDVDGAKIGYFGHG